MERLLSYHTLLLSPGAPLTYFNDVGGGGGVRVIFLGREKKTEGFSGVAKKGLRDFWGYVKKSSDFFWVNKF